MNYNNSTEAYLRSTAKIGIRQYGRSRELIDLSGWLALWKPVAKILLLILPVVLCIHMFVVSAITDVNLSIVNVGDQRHELMDKNIGLLASKARLWSPASMEQLAAEKLALHSSSGDQVGRFNPRTGTFIYP